MLIEELKKYKAHITAIQEMRWTGNKILQKKFDLYYSGHNQKHMFGTDFIVAKKYNYLVLDFDPVSKRICVLRIKSRFFNLSIINAHALIEDKNEGTKDDFYKILERVYDSRPKNDAKILIRDLNTQIGEQIYRKCAGRHSVHEFTNDNGSRLMSFAASRHMFVRSIKLEHKEIHKITWKRHSGDAENQIDHILIDRRHLSDLLDVRVYKGANIDSDHFLVGAKLRAKISSAKCKRAIMAKRYNTECLKITSMQEAYATSLEEKLHELQEEEVDKQWERCRQSICQAAETIWDLRIETKEAPGLIRNARK